MDSIEKMRRINNLTKELKQRGFADSSFEAIQQANQIYGFDEVNDDVKHGLITSSQNDKIGRENMDEYSTNANNAKVSKLSENMELLTSKMNEMIKAINDLDSKYSELKTKYDSLNSKYTTLASRPVEVQVSNVSHSNGSDRSEFVEVNTVSNHGQSPVAQQTATHAVEGSKTKSEYDMNQRTGGFQSQDVSIDKMFYFGKK